MRRPYFSQKNDMLLRNMIFRLNDEKIDSPEGEYDIWLRKMFHYSAAILMHNMKKRILKIDEFVSYKKQRYVSHFG